MQVEGRRNGHLVAKTEYPCCSACEGSGFVGGLLGEALPNHAIFSQEDSPLAPLAKRDSSREIPDALESFTLNPYLMA